MRPIALLIMSALLLPLVSAAPVPKAKKPVYHPTTVGTKWVMSSGKARTSHEVTAVEEKNGDMVVTFEENRETVVSVEDERWESLGKFVNQRVVSADGVFGVGQADERVTFLKLPMKKGDKWLIHKGRDFEAEYVAGDVETVKVPAGEFEAVRVDARWTPRGKEQVKVTFWYAPVYGMVKQDLDGTEWVMTSFEKGKK